LTSGDIYAMIAYLKSVPPVADASNPAAVRTPLEPPHPVPLTVSAGSPSLGLQVFEGACASCHSFDGSGTVWPQADLVGDRTVNDPAAVNLTQVVIPRCQPSHPRRPSLHAGLWRRLFRRRDRRRCKLCDRPVRRGPVADNGRRRRKIR
jgi:hypothetical protein